MSWKQLLIILCAAFLLCGFGCEKRIPALFKKGDMVISKVDGKPGLVCDIWYQAHPAEGPPYYRYHVRFDSARPLVMVNEFEIKED